MEYANSSEFLEAMANDMYALGYRHGTNTAMSMMRQVLVLVSAEFPDMKDSLDVLANQITELVSNFLKQKMAELGPGVLTEEDMLSEERAELLEKYQQQGKAH
jgi:thymidine phosphorylase